MVSNETLFREMDMVMWTFGLFLPVMAFLSRIYALFDVPKYCGSVPKIDKYQVWVWIIANIYWETYIELNSWALLLRNTSFKEDLGFLGLKWPWIDVHFSGVRLGTDWGSGRWYHGTECGRNPEAAWQPGEPVQSRPFWLSLPWSKWTLLIWPTRPELGISG